MSLVGKGKNDTAISSSKFSRMTALFAYCKRRKIPWWASQMPPIVRKLVT